MIRFPIALQQVRFMQIIVTCEHAGNTVPASYKKQFLAHSALLKTHRGFDIGAYFIAKQISERLRVPFVHCDTTRLLVDPNRSTHSKSLFFLPLSQEEKQAVLARYYFPYRWKVQDIIERYPKVLHLSIHSFTPVFQKKEGVEKRNCDMALLYDPKRCEEKKVCKEMQKELRCRSAFTVRLNYPYRGISDGLTTHFRKLYGKESYLGIEVEINQKHLLHDNLEIASILETAIRQSV